VKSSSVASLAGDQAALDLAQAAVRKNPQALFTNFQWFLYHSKNTVYFTAFSKTAFDKDSLANFVAEMVSLAPQLTHGFVGARPGQPFPKHILDAVTSVIEVDDFEGYPDKWLGKGVDIFEHKDLPLFRVYAATRRGGPDENGHASMVLVRSSHALLEGNDSSMLSRSQSIAREASVIRKSKKALPFKARFKLGIASTIGAALQLYFSHAKPSPVKDIRFKSLAVERERIRDLANRIGVRQRSLMFGLITQALNVADKEPNHSFVAAAYTMLDHSNRTQADDDQFNVRALLANFPVKADFIDYVRSIETTLQEVEKADTTKFQYVMLGMFALHRRISRVLPGLYGAKFFNLNRRTDVVLTLVPPHRMYGNMTRSLTEPVYVGSFHPSSNLCTFVPGREFVTFNFAMEQKYLDRADGILELLSQIEARDIAPAPSPAALEAN